MQWSDQAEMSSSKSGRRNEIDDDQIRECSWREREEVERRTIQKPRTRCVSRNSARICNLMCFSFTPNVKLQEKR